MAEWIANSEPSLHKMIGDLRQLWQEKRYLKVSAKVGTARSLPQNALQHVWYTQMGLEDRQMSQQEHERYCKYTHGVPILCSDDPDYREFCRRLLGPLPYESRLEAMDHFPVTRLFNKDQESRYLDRVQADYGKRGVQLTFPDKAAQAA